MAGGNPFNTLRRYQLPGPQSVKKQRAKTTPITEETTSSRRLRKIPRASDGLLKNVKNAAQNGPVTAPNTTHFASSKGTSRSRGKPVRKLNIESIHLMASLCRESLAGRLIFGRMAIDQDSTVANAAVSFCHVTFRSSAKTRVSPMVVMKFESPNQRGRTCMWM